MKESSERFSSPETTVMAIPSRILEQKPSRQMPKGIHNPETPLVYIDRYSPDHATNHDKQKLKCWQTTETQRGTNSTIRTPQSSTADAPHNNPHTTNTTNQHNR